MLPVPKTEGFFTSVGNTVDPVPFLRRHRDLVPFRIVEAGLIVALFGVENGFCRFALNF